MSDHSSGWQHEPEDAVLLSPISLKCLRTAQVRSDQPSHVCECSRSRGHPDQHRCDCWVLWKDDD